MITDEFLKWLRTAKGSELVKYKTDNEREKYLIDKEIEDRIEANTPKILDGVFSFLSSIMDEDEEKK